MSKNEKTAPAASGNPAVRLYPSEVNAAGVIVNPLKSVEYKPKGGKSSVQLEVAFMRNGNGPICVLVGGKCSNSTAAGWGNPCTVKGDAYESIEAAAEAAQVLYFDKVGINISTCIIQSDITALLPAGAEYQACAAALGLTEQELDDYIVEDKQPAGAAVVAAKPSPRILAKDRQMARYNYTDAELVGFAQELASTHRAIANIEARKQRANQQFKTELETESDKVEDFSERIREGYEMREYPCTTYADTPEKGKKSVIRDDTGEVLRVMPMTHVDLQEELPLGDKRKSAAVSFEDEDDANAE